MQCRHNMTHLADSEVHLRRTAKKGESSWTDITNTIELEQYFDTVDLRLRDYFDSDVFHELGTRPEFCF